MFQPGSFRPGTGPALAPPKEVLRRLLTHPLRHGDSVTVPLLDGSQVECVAACTSVAADPASSPPAEAPRLSADCDLGPALAITAATELHFSRTAVSATATVLSAPDGRGIQATPRAALQAALAAVAGYHPNFRQLGLWMWLGTQQHRAAALGLASADQNGGGTDADTDTGGGGTGGIEDGGLPVFLEQRSQILLCGPAGVGKTAAIEGVAAALGAIRTLYFEPQDDDVDVCSTLRGLYARARQEQVRACVHSEPYSAVASTSAHDRRGLLRRITDITRATPTSGTSVPCCSCAL